MNIFHFGKQFNIGDIDIFYSFILAIRIMIGTESLDFEIDTRGRLPRSIRRKIDLMADWQMSFIIGHEYAHHYLGHLENSGISSCNDRVSYIKSNSEYYTYHQNCEFEADSHSISEYYNYTVDKENLTDGAFLFFLFLDMYDRIEDYLFPKIFPSRTHPKPLERLWALRRTIDNKIGLTTEQLKSIINSNNNFVDGFLRDFLPYNVEKIEMIGSVYLPGYKKKMLVDRLDI